MKRELVTLDVESRDLGYGSECWRVDGYFTGEVDTWGKHTFIPDDGSDTIYLFPDEYEVVVFHV